jgi:hypothetical protein
MTMSPFVVESAGVKPAPLFFMIAPPGVAIGAPFFLGVVMYSFAVLLGDCGVLLLEGDDVWVTESSFFSFPEASFVVLSSCSSAPPSLGASPFLSTSIDIDSPLTLGVSSSSVVAGADFVVVVVVVVVVVAGSCCCGVAVRVVGATAASDVVLLLLVALLVGAAVVGFDGSFD